MAWLALKDQRSAAAAVVVPFSPLCPSHSTGLGFITSHRLREYEAKKLLSPACSRLENAIVSPHIHATNGK